MSHAQSISTPQHDSLQPPRGDPSNEHQGDRSPPPPPLEGAWLCDEPYKYSLKSSENPLVKCNEFFRRNDEDTCKQLKEEITFLMVVVGLILAIVAAFTVESYKFLQEDKEDTMSDLLIEVVRLLNDTSAQGKAQLPKPFTPKHYAIVVNQLWFLSMVLNLIAVAMGTFCLQWISALSRGNSTEKPIQPEDSIALRQLRREGLVSWGVHYAPEALLFMVQLSIGLFTFGLIYFLWNVNKATAVPVTVAACLTGALLYLINLIPFFQPLIGAFIPATLTLPLCPYKSPTSWLVQNAGYMLFYIFKLVLSLLLRNWVEIIGRPGRWLDSLPPPFTDFDWKKYDTIFRDLRQLLHPRLSYLQSGLLSALDHFLDERDVADITSGYIEYLVPRLTTSNDWKTFSAQELSIGEVCFLDGNWLLKWNSLPRHLNTLQLQLGYVLKIRDDFIRALTLQGLAQDHERLSGLLLEHRVELYIRVKTSTRFILGFDGSPLEVGRSLECPCQNAADIVRFKLALKFQFLRCLKHLIDTRRFNDLDIMNAAAIVAFSGPPLSETLPQNIQNPSETPHIEPPAEEEHTGLLANQSSPKNDQIGNFSNQPDSGTTSSPPNDLETGGPKSATLNAGAEDHQLRSSFGSLCVEMTKQLSGLRRSDFKKEIYYVEMRFVLDLPLEPEPDTAHTVINVREHEGT